MAGRSNRLSLVSTTWKGGESDGHQQLLGLVIPMPVAGGNGPSGEPCSFCGEVGSHLGWCPAVSKMAGR